MILSSFPPQAIQEAVSLMMSPQVSLPPIASHLGLSNIHLENSMILSLSFVVGSHPRLFRSSPEMAYLK